MTTHTDEFYDNLDSTLIPTAYAVVDTTNNNVVLNCTIISENVIEIAPPIAYVVAENIYPCSQNSTYNSLPDFEEITTVMGEEYFESNNSYPAMIQSCDDNMNFFEYDNNHTETNLNNLMNVSDLTCTAIDVIEMHKLYELCEKDISDDISDNLVSKPSIDMNEFEILLSELCYQEDLKECLMNFVATASDLDITTTPILDTNNALIISNNEPFNNHTTIATELITDEYNSVMPNNKDNITYSTASSSSSITNVHNYDSVATNDIFRDILDEMNYNDDINNKPMINNRLYYTNDNLLLSNLQYINNYTSTNTSYSDGMLFYTDSQTNCMTNNIYTDTNNKNIYRANAIKKWINKRKQRYTSNNNKHNYDSNNKNQNKTKKETILKNKNPVCSISNNSDFSSICQSSHITNHNSTDSGQLQPMSSNYTNNHLQFDSMSNHDSGYSTDQCLIEKQQILTTEYVSNDYIPSTVIDSKLLLSGDARKQSAAKRQRVNGKFKKCQIKWVSCSNQCSISSSGTTIT